MRGLLTLLGGLILVGAFIYALKIHAAADWLTESEIEDIIEEHEHDADDPNPPRHWHGPTHGHSHDE